MAQGFTAPFGKLDHFVTKIKILLIDLAFRKEWRNSTLIKGHLSKLDHFAILNAQKMIKCIKITIGWTQWFVGQLGILYCFANIYSFEFFKMI